jgi:hypothetical protein
MQQTARMFVATLTLIGVLLMVPPAKPASAATVLYAKPTAAGLANCSTWDDACTLQSALSAVTFEVVADPPYGGTIFIDPDIITSRDITTFQGATYAGQGMRWMFDRRVNDWIHVNAYLFTATFSDGLTIEIQVNPEFADATTAEAVTLKYCEVIGRIPTVLRKDVQTVWIHKGNQPFGGGNNNLLIHTEQGDSYEASGILEETFIHEASHTSLDSAHSAASGWLAAQSSDGNFISTYARDYPDTEDIAESFLTYLAIRYRSDRISQADYDTITQTIPNRIAYFDSQAFDLYPMNLIYKAYIPIVSRQ